MAREATLKLHAEIRKDFHKMSNIIEKNTQKFSTQYIINSIADKYFKSPITIENIVFNRVNYGKES